MDHIIRLADLREMLEGKDPTDKIVVCSESGTQYTIADIGRDGGQGRILINFHGDTADLEKIKELENQLEKLEEEKEEIESDYAKCDEEKDSLAAQVEDLKKQVLELEEKMKGADEN